MTLASTPIVHHPFKFGIGRFELTGFGIAVLMAFLIAQVVSERELARRGHDVEATAVGDVLFAALLGTLLGAKLYYVIVVTHQIRDLFSRGRVVLGGGVACNATLIAAMRERFEPRGVQVFAPSARLATDNAAMIARAGLFHLERGEQSPLDLNAFASQPIPGLVAA